MLQAENLTMRYNDYLALDNLNLQINPGDIYCLLGANGAGKSTTLNLFLGFIEPTSGSTRINDLSVQSDPIGTKRFISYIPEVVMLYRNLTGLENLRYFATLGGHKEHTTGDLLGFLRRAGLPEDAPHKRIGGYSKGMRQKVGIAIALARQAKALLLDEPTSGLDPKASNEFSELLVQLSREGVAVLMATHDLFRAKECGTRVGIMKRGKLMADIRTEDVGHSDLEKLYLDLMQ